MSITEGPKIPRQVYLPLEKLDKCAVCAKTSSLRLCSSCGERIYCSSECQTSDWKAHKKECGKTDRIDLATFHPFLACLAEMARMNQSTPVHPSFSHAIINDPNPNCNPTEFPDGSAAKLIILGDTIPLEELGTEKWWPTAISDKVRSKLLRRMGREGHILPIVISTCLGLLAEMYTTTSISAADSPDGKPKSRTRLRYRSSPIVDFGIAKGSASVTNQDKFAYLNLLDNEFTKGQDPNDHYWIYFTTIRGEDVLLDCGLFTFNMCMVVAAGPYRESFMPPVEYAPLFFRDRVLSKNTPEMHTETQRFSVLRDASLHTAIEDTEGFGEIEAKLVWAFMDKVSGRKSTDIEQDLVLRYSLINFRSVGAVLSNKSWKKYPEAVPLAIEADPGELDHSPQGKEETDAWWKYQKKWNKLHREGKISKDTLHEAFQAWRIKKNT